MMDLGAAEFAQSDDLKRHLAWESFVALARDPGRVAVIDCTLQRRTMKRGLLLALAWGLSKRVQAATEKPRVGIVFPPGLGATLANLAVVLAGKVPVNLNFTLGRSSLESCLKRADVDCLLTTRRVQEKLTAFPWPDTGVLDVVDLLPTLSKLKTFALLAAIRILPAGFVAARLGLPRDGDGAEAGLLFTSGSSGEPKGVALSHRNILGNCAQIDAAGLLARSETLLANLPLFHCFGFTIGLWYPLLRGCRMVTLSSPLEVKKIAGTVAAEGVTVLLGTPTFFRPYLKRVDPSKLASVNYVIAGAEKTPEGFAEAWEDRFDSRYLEGYGLTETSPVVSVNLPEAASSPDEQGLRCRVGARRGSVGRMLPGHAARIVHPETGEALPPTATGLLMLKGPNVFAGYLDAPEQTAEVKNNGWFSTGDLARFDEDGFLYIEGRRSRFSKIGGEMVPHGTVEQALLQAYDLLESELPMLAVAARPDEAKGEALVLLSTFEIDPTDLRTKLEAAGFPNLWVPKCIKQVEAIPTLATGKLDLRAIKELAEKA